MTRNLSVLFFVGGALGVDMWAGEQLLTLRAQTGYEDIKIVVVVPFIGYDSKWPDQSRHRLKKLIQNANDSIVISHSADVSSYKKRNYYMVDHAEYLIGVFDNQKKLRSGTAQTVNYALPKRKSNHSDPSRYYGNNNPYDLTNSQKFFIGISNKIFSLKGCCDIIRYKTTLRTNGAAMNKYIEQQFAALRYEKKIFWLLKKLHLLVDAAPSTRLLHVLRQPVLMTVRRGAFFIV